MDIAQQLEDIERVREANIRLNRRLHLALERIAAIEQDKSRHESDLELDEVHSTDC